VPCNANDTGTAVGGIFDVVKPKEQVNLAFANFDLFDRDKLPNYIRDRNGKLTNNQELISHIRAGKIIGIVKGKSECGPRALGNRSIICDPSFKNMKDILNQKVKQREWYRPFAPMVLQHEASEYFVWDNSEAPFMSFSAHVRSKYQDFLASITHVDYSARIQTINEQDNPWYYSLLNDMKATGLPVLLNTSFNIRGNPILNTIEDAFYVLDNTELDLLYIEGYLFSK
jgi:carbamoyltransferase